MSSVPTTSLTWHSQGHWTDLCSLCCETDNTELFLTLLSPLPQSKYDGKECKEVAMYLSVSLAMQLKICRGLACWIVVACLGFGCQYWDGWKRKPFEMLSREKVSLFWGFEPGYSVFWMTRRGGRFIEKIDSHRWGRYQRKGGSWVFLVMTSSWCFCGGNFYW